MKNKIILITITISLLISSYSYASDNVLKIDDVLTVIENSPTMQNLQFSLNDLNNYYETVKEISDLIPVQLRANIQSALSQTVTGPPITIFVFGVPITYDHTLSKSEITQVLANFGFSFTKNDRLSEDLMVYHTPKVIVSNIKVLEKTKELTLETLKLSAKELYNGIQIQSKLLDFKKEMVAIDQIKSIALDAKLSKGIISKKDYEASMLVYEQNSLNRDIEIRKHQNMIYMLNNLLGNDISMEYEEIENTIIEKDEVVFDLEKSIESAISDRFEIYQINQNIENLERELMFTNIYYAQNEPQYLSKKYELRAQIQKLEDTKNDIRYELEDAYNTLILNYNEIRRSKIRLENANVVYKDTHKKFDSGLITNEILSMSHLGITSAQISLMGAISNYNISVERFQKASGFGPAFTGGGRK